MQEIGEIDEMANNGRYSKISRRIWNDEKVRRLSRPPPCGQSLFVRLLVGPELTVIPGLFQAWESGMAESIGWNVRGFRKAFAEIENEELAFADWRIGLVFVPNAINHNEPASPNVVSSWESTWAELPECDLKTKAFETLREWASIKGESWLESFEKACQKPFVKPSCKSIVKGYNPPSPNQEQKQEQKQEQEELTQSDTSADSGSGSVGETVASKPKSSHQAVIDFYHKTFESVRGIKPIIGPRDGRAVKELLIALGGDREAACNCIKNAFSDPWWKDKATIINIANDPSKFAVSTKGKRVPPQPNDEKNRYVPPEA